MKLNLALLRIAACSLAAIFGAMGTNLRAAWAEPSHGIAMRGVPALPANYDHFGYVNPDAPKGGKLVYGVQGSFDDLNPFDLKSIRTGGRGVWDPVFGNLVYESLLKRNKDEAFSLYGLLAQKVELPEDRSWIEFHLDPRARFSDDKPVTVDDVIFTFDLLKEKGRPPYSSRMKQVEKMEQTGPRSVRIWFNDLASRETPLLFGLMPVLPKHAIDADAFGSSTLEPPIGTGPYTITEVRPGERLVYTRNPNYWGRDIPSQRGFFNFDTIQVDYYRAPTAQFEAFKKGLFDLYPENSPAKWRTAYDFGAANDGRVIKEQFRNQTPSGMLGLVFNTRRAKFADVRIRKALATIFDFEWANENLFFGAYTRTTSYWQESVLSSFQIPASEGERKLLAAYPGAVSPDVLNGTYHAPKADGTGRDRKQLRSALSLFREAGYALKDGKLVDPNGEPLVVELLAAGGAGISGQDIQRLALSFKNTAAKLGVGIEVRLVDDSQYQQRKGAFDYDLTVVKYSSSLSPGAEQTFRWGSQSRDLEGSFNFAGTAEPVIDFLIDKLLAAKTEQEFTDAVRAYDRVLISGHYVVPLYHQAQSFLARWAHIERPTAEPLYGPQYSSWWSGAR